MIDTITKTIITTIEEDLLIEEAMKNIKVIIKNNYMEIIIKILTMRNTLIITKIKEVSQEIEIEIEVFIDILRILIIIGEEMGVQINIFNKIQISRMITRRIRRRLVVGNKNNTLIMQTTFHRNKLYKIIVEKN